MYIQPKTRMNCGRESQPESRYCDLCGSPLIMIIDCLDYSVEINNRYFAPWGSQASF